MTPAECALRWRGKERWVLLTTGFEVERFLALWAAWRADPQRCERLHVIAIEAAPPTRAELAERACDPACEPLRQALVAAWPPATPDLHTLGFEAGRVGLGLAVGATGPWLASLLAQVDAFEIADPAAAGPNGWRSLARLAAPGATLSTGPLPGAEADRLRATGFRLDPGHADATHAVRATYAPAFVPRRRGGLSPPTLSQDRQAVIVGGGLAGCAAAWALAEQGWRSIVVDAHAAPAGAASGNPAGLFHGIVNRQDGAHARLHRVAAVQARFEIEHALREHGVAGSTAGLLRGETRLGLREMHALLARLGLPTDYVRAVDALEASALCGLPRGGPAWFYAGAGWVDPAGYARSLLARAGTACRWVGHRHVERLREAGEGWQLLDAQGGVIAAAPVVVLANAADALRLARMTHWPVETVRGQLSWLDPQPGPARIPLPRIALAAPGYLLPAVGGRAVFGATAQRGDADPGVRRDDHARNLAQLEQLLGHALAVDAGELGGRTAWRCTARDRLPIIGALPVEATPPGEPQRRPDRLRDVARRPGLFIYAGLGSRGIAWSALGARVLAATVASAPSPLPAPLRDAVDPARFLLSVPKLRAVRTLNPSPRPSPRGRG